MKLDLRVEISELQKALKRISSETGKECKPIVKKAGRLIVEKTMRLTPPGGGGLGWAQAKKRGNAAIAVDLFGGARGGRKLGNNKKNRRMGIFFSVKASTLQRFKDVDGHKVKIKQKEATDSETLFIKKTGEVYATQSHNYHPNASLSDMMAHHRRYFKKGRMTSSISGMATTGQWMFVDSFVTTTENLLKFLQFLQGRIGIWAAGFMPAAKELGMKKAPKWISKHAEYAKGDCKITETPSSYQIKIINSSGYGSLSRIIPYALAGTREGMIKEMERAKAAVLKKAGLKK
jgi:hypothetical protein